MLKSKKLCDAALANDKTCLRPSSSKKDFDLDLSPISIDPKDPAVFSVPSPP